VVGGAACFRSACRRSTASEGRHLFVRLSSKRRLLRSPGTTAGPALPKRASARPVTTRAAAIVLAREKLATPCIGSTHAGGLPCERRVLPQKPLEHQSARFAERRFRSPPARFPAPLYGHSWEPESHPGCSARSQEPMQRRISSNAASACLKRFSASGFCAAGLRSGCRVDAIRLLDGLQDEVRAIFPQRDVGLSARRRSDRDR
jgi:hypothetical protein